MNSSPTVIVNKNFIQNGIMQRLNILNTRISSNILPDLIFPDCTPSLAIVYIEEKSFIRSILINKLLGINKVFTNAFIIIIGHIEFNINLINQLQFNHDFLLYPQKIFHTLNIIKASELTHDIYNSMKQNDKFKLQLKYFEIERNKIISKHTSQTILYELLLKLNIPEDEYDILCGALPSIYHIINVTKEILIENCPVSNETIDKIIDLF